MHAPQQQLLLWDVPTGRELMSLDPELKLIRSIEFSPDGRQIIVAGQNLNGFGEVVFLDCEASEQPIKPNEELVLSDESHANVVDDPSSASNTTP